MIWFLFRSAHDASELSTSMTSLPLSIVIASLPLLIGFIIDLMIGDPAWIPHPIRLMGFVIRQTERALRRLFGKSDRSLFAGGVVLAVFVPLLFLSVSYLVLALGYQIHFWVGFALECLFSWQVLATRSLCDESAKVYRALEKRNLVLARKHLSWLVGRDTETLSEADVTRACVETVAENTTDGVIAPLLYLAIGGVPLAMAYKAINTLDSMVGYRSKTYLFFGRASARLDDVVNYLPARIAAFLMIAASFILHYPVGRIWRIYRRDKRQHLSPNSAQTEAVCAGALGIRLGGTHTYSGQIVEKPSIGDDTQVPFAGDIMRAQTLLYLTVLIGVGPIWLIRLLSLMNGSLFLDWVSRM